MQIVHTIPDLRAALSAYQKPAFVPTMGNLHDGHIALVNHAKGLGDVRVASIFINRLQFLPHEDFDSYPRTFEADCAKLQAAGCNIVFAPTEKDLYPEPQTYKVTPDPALASILEGEFRPGFFTGVCTVVMKLFAAVFAGKAQGVAVFGHKDYQQCMVIRGMVRQFALPVDVVAVPTQRSSAGLALSSRNGYLDAAQLQEAQQLSQALRRLADAALASGAKLPTQLAALEHNAIAELTARGWEPDYFTVRQRSNLLPPLEASEVTDWRGQLVALGAARLGSTRLIDNLEF